MNSELYSLLALAFRYWFAFLLAVVVFRAWRVTRTDSRRARLLRGWTNETGCVGELVVLSKRGKRQEALPVPKEGVLGSARRADVRVRAKDVLRYHLDFELREGGLLVRPRNRARVLLNDQIEGERIFVRDGDTLTVGDVRLLFVYFDVAPVQPNAPEPDLIHKRPNSEKGRRAELTQDDLFFEEELWPDE